MSLLVKPIRTWLFAPGMDARKCEKAVQSAADALILDLEDAVAISEKPKARLMLNQLVKSVSPERQVYVRVNDFMTGMTAEDLRAVCTGGIAGIVLPKAESAEMVRIASTMIDEFSRAEGLSTWSDHDLRYFGNRTWRVACRGDRCGRRSPVHTDVRCGRLHG